MARVLNAISHPSVPQGASHSRGEALPVRFGERGQGRQVWLADCEKCFGSRGVVEG